MSGGVDSAVAAARAVDAGHDVTGVHLALSRAPEAVRAGARGCCTVEDSRDARRAADVLGIPFYIWDLAEQFRADVIDDFVAEYAAGRTPNPCLRCNEKIKFSAVLDRARALGFDAVVTGHHAKLEHREDGTPHLARSVDMGKDQSYVLAVLTPEQLRYAMFPLGEGYRSPTSLTATTSASSPTVTPRGSSSSTSASGRVRSSMQTPGRSSASMTAPTRSQSASARACGSETRSTMANHATSWTSPRSTTGSRSVRRTS